MANKLMSRKKKALQYFLQNLLQGEVKQDIAKVFLFGSMSERRVSRASDIDLLVFSIDNMEKVRRNCADLSFETAVRYGESVEPLVYCADDLRFSNSIFLRASMLKGKELYKMTDRDLAKRESRNYLELARDYSQQARNSLKNKDLRLAADGAYNACELAVKGLLLLKMKQFPKTHGGVVQKFGQLYVKTNVLPQEAGRSLNLGLALRNRARYDYHAAIEENRVRELLDLSASLIDALEKHSG